MVKQVDKPFANGTWTNARYWGFIRSNLRRARWPVKYMAKKEAERDYKGPNKRQKFEYLCASCNKWFKGSEVAIDHITPCGSLKCSEDLAGFVERLFCELDGYQVLCHDCHQIKTKEERDAKRA